MKNIKISFLIDALFLFIALFFVFYAIVKPLVKSVFLSTLITIAVCVTGTAIYTAISIKKHGKKAVLDGEEKNYNAFLKTLSIMPEKDAFSLVISYFESMGKEGVKFGNKIKLKGCKEEVFFDFSPGATTLKTLLSAYKQTSKNCSLIFIAFDYELNAVNYFAGFDKRVTLITAKTFYETLKKENLLPEITAVATRKPSLKERFLLIFKREKAPVFLAWGGAILLFSTVAYYKLLYVIVGGILIAFSLTLRFFAVKSPPPEKAL